MSAMMITQPEQQLVTAVDVGDSSMDVGVMTPKPCRHRLVCEERLVPAQRACAGRRERRACAGRREKWASLLGGSPLCSAGSARMYSPRRC